MIFHHLQMIFVGIPKNASTSIHLSLYDKNLSVEDIHNSHNHEPIKSEARYPYEMVCMVRNPYDRVKSAYKMFPERLTFKQKLRNFVNMGWERFIDNEVHFRPQWWFTTINGKYMMDTTLRLENPNDWTQFMNSRPNGMIRPLQWENVSKMEEPEMDEETIGMINYLYRDDFYMFNYEMR